MAKNFVVSMILNARETVSGPMRRVQSMLTGIRARASAVTRSLGFHKITDGFRRLGSSFAGLGRHISGVGVGLLGLAGIGFGGGVLAWLHSGAGEADVLAKFGRTVGISTERLQQWQHAANQAAGMSNEELRKSFRDLAKNVGDAANGIGRAKPIFEALGIPLRDNQGNVRDLNDLLPELQSAFRKIENPALRTSTAMKLFGESGSKMSLLLQQPQEEMDRLFGDMERLGMISNEAAADTEAYNDALDSWGKSFTGIRNGLMAYFMPMMTPLIKKMTEFMVSMRPEVVERLGSAISGAANTMMGWFTVAQDGTTPAGQALKSFMATIESLISYGGKIVDFLGGWQNAALALGGILAGPFIASLLSVGTAFAQLGWILASNPIVLAAGLIAGAVYTIYDNWDGIVGYFTGKIDAVRSAFKTGFIDGVMAYMAEFNPFAILYDGFTGLVKYLTDFDLAAMISEKVQAMMSVLPDWVKDKIGVSVSGETPKVPPPGAPPPPPAGAGSMVHNARQVEQAKAQVYQGAKAPDPVEGKIVVEIVGDGAANARVRQSKSTGIGLETSLRTGPSLAGMGAG
ncbi:MULTISPECIES: phage tail tape measure protein [Thalassospira]|uniref:phage tail tape measure protein n=1 Tax=Thalassospira TaxID=168934 RepID=UPI0008279707|nr:MULTISPECIES: phage tail tape measure protein [Thalassospira]OCK08664.1 phage tail tape measure protein, TP901 family [Thalassospira sp. KO164]SEE54601.1 phage tail tape measure protein, TP901 family, core region [Thalassospira permensis]